MSLASGHKGRTSSVMDKKIHENPRYSRVSSRLDTGSSMSKYNRKVEDVKNNYKFKQGEIFKRMKVSTFVQLVLQVENYVSESDVTGLSPVPDENEEEEETLPPTPGSDTHRSCDSRFSEVISGVGEMDLKNNNVNVPQTVTETPPKPYLLLDVRDSDAFDQCHIIGAVNFPSAMLSRAQNYFTKTVLEYVNKEGKIIILYDEDERIAHACSTTMIERGVDNLFMLSGGMKVLYSKFPTGIIRGPLPKLCLVDNEGKVSKAKVKAQQGVQPANVHPMGNEFTEDDLDHLQDTLDSLLESMAPPTRVGGMSRAQSNMSQRSATSACPWK